MEDHREQADALEHEAEELEHEGERLDEDIDDARKDWEAKKDASDVPGAVPDEGEEGDA